MGFTIDVGHDVPVYSLICTWCEWLDISNNQRPGKCAAFPDGIPMEIWIGENDHTKPYLGDNGIQFERVEMPVETGEKGNDKESNPVEKILLTAVKSVGALSLSIKQLAGQHKYQRSILGAVQNLWNGNIDKADFIGVLTQLIPIAFEQAWLDGAKAAGIVGIEELTKEERDALQARIDAEVGFAKNGSFADYIIAHNKAAGFKLGSLRHRASLWWNRYTDVVNEARMMAGGNKKYRWQWFPEKEHCFSCQKLNGKVKRMSYWKEHDCRPQHPDLECMHSAGGATVCGCEFVETDEPCSRGPLPRWRAA